LSAEFNFERETNTSPIILSSVDGDFEQIIKQQQEQIAILLVLIA